MFFANEQRDKVREDNPGIKFGTSLSCLPHCHRSPTNMSQARSARSSVRTGRLSATSRRSRTMPRPRPTSSVTRKRRLPTPLYVDTLTIDHHCQTTELTHHIGWRRRGRGVSVCPPAPPISLARRDHIGHASVICCSFLLFFSMLARGVLLTRDEIQRTGFRAHFSVWRLILPSVFPFQTEAQRNR